jgi:hypothetical protein
MEQAFSTALVHLQVVSHITAPKDRQKALSPRQLPPSLTQGAASQLPNSNSMPNCPAGTGASLEASKDSKVALQAVVDALSASLIEPADPPESSMRVPLLKHQRLALGWMLSREGARSTKKALCPNGGMLADDQVSFCNLLLHIRIFFTCRHKQNVHGHGHGPTDTRSRFLNTAIPLKFHSSGVAVYVVKVPATWKL